MAPSAPAPSPTSRPLQGDTAHTNRAPVTQDAGKSAPSTGAAVRHSAGVEEILKMAQAGVSMEVIKTYIESSPVAYDPSPDDLIALKERGIPDDVTMALVKRGAALRAQVSPSGNLSAMPAAYPDRRRYGRLDPESYDYFQYYYLYPRTLAYANQRLFSPYPSFSGFAPYPYGYYGPLPFRTLPPEAFRHP